MCTLFANLYVLSTWGPHMIYMGSPYDLLWVPIWFTWVPIYLLYDWLFFFCVISLCTHIESSHIHISITFCCMLHVACCMMTAATHIAINILLKKFPVNKIQILMFCPCESKKNEKRFPWLWHPFSSKIHKSMYFS